MGGRPGITIIDPSTRTMGDLVDLRWMSEAFMSIM
jgi:hypothetical protein